MEKKDFGCGITTGLGRKYLIRTLVEEDQVSFATYDTLQLTDENGTDVWISLCDGSEVYPANCTFETELPELVHNDAPLPVHYTLGNLIPGELFGKSEEYAFRLRSVLTLDKSFDVHGLNPETLWAIHSDITILMKADGSLILPHNKFAATKTSKQDGRNYILRQGVSAIAQIYLGSSLGGFSGDGIRLTVSEDIGYYSNLTFDVEVPITKAGFHDFGANFYEIMTTDETLECSAGGTVQMPVEVTNADGGAYNGDIKVYIKTDAGYLPRTNLELVDGLGEFTFMALGLSVGELATVKFGYKWYENSSSIDITVVA